MQNKKIIILIILGVGAVISLFYGILAPSKARRNIILRPTSRLQGLRIESQTARLIRNAKKTAYSSWSIDPFSASSAPIQGYGRLALNGIMWWEKENPKAIINNNIVSIGDKVGQDTVIDIKQDRVIFNDGSKNFELRLNERQ